jgi:hypothetical protein
MPSKISDTPKPWICNHEGSNCDEAFVLKRQLVCHQRDNQHESRKRPFSCDHKESNCRKTFILKKELTRHQRAHYPGKTVYCKYCEYKSSRRDTLNMHIERIHAGVLDGRVKKRLTRNSKKSNPLVVSSTSFDVECIPVRDEGLGKCSNLKVYFPKWVAHSDVVFSEISKMLRDRRSEDTLPNSAEDFRYCIKLCVDNLKNHINCG